MILGLTGGIGSGKSTVSKIFLSMGIKVFDADLIAKDILETEEVKEEIKEKFGKEFINLKNNSVDKELLKKEVFNNSKKLKILNEIVHPKVVDIYKKKYLEYKDRKEIVIFDIPLLFEVNLQRYCDKVMVVDIDLNVQIERIKNRDNIDIPLIKKIISAQMSREERNMKADILIENNGSLEKLKQKIEKIIKDIERGKI
ncbi:dephospho-CoA kinase [Cetobacterium somerae]|uniref:dephospho-CoA kinase n=1 Tax=Cetobacterium somerae TaxID=188913 RepID=UPI001F061E08|nr:dephospho-CoA kinase [Cetobacterium somerae]MCX3068028.1 dephospho-CoA kinase [Cetobacterium somerae]UPO97117.1 dephospho-CoA kinase [Cetobacterium somerae]